MKSQRRQGWIWLAAGGAVLGLLAPLAVEARELLTQDQAFQEMFGPTDEILTRTCVLSAKELAEFKRVLGGKLIHYQEGLTPKAEKELSEYTFYLGVRGGKWAGVALIEEQPGKWGPVKTVIAMDPATGKVKNLAVMSYTEVRGRPVAQRSFLDQFVGKGAEDPITIQSDIRAITGATISSDATCFAVKKAVLLYEEIFRK